MLHHSYLPVAFKVNWDLVIALMVVPVSFCFSAGTGDGEAVFTLAFPTAAKAQGESFEDIFRDSVVNPTGDDMFGSIVESFACTPAKTDPGGSVLIGQTVLIS